MTRDVKAPGLNLLGGLTRLIGPTGPSHRGSDKPPSQRDTGRSAKTAPDSETQLEKLLRGLDRVDLDVGKGTLLLFVRCPTTKLNAVVRKPGRHIVSRLSKLH